MPWRQKKSIWGGFFRFNQPLKHQPQTVNSTPPSSIVNQAVFMGHFQMALKRSVFELEGQIFDILEHWYLSFEICNQIENPSTVRPLAGKRRPAARAENFPRID